MGLQLCIFLGLFVFPKFLWTNLKVLRGAINVPFLAGSYGCH